MRFNRYLILVTCISLLSACVATNPNKDHISHNDTSNVQFSPIAHAATAELLNFIAEYSSSTSVQQAQVYQDVLEASRSNPNDNKLLIKKAAMLAIPNSEVRNITDAITLLNALLSANNLNTSDTHLVSLLLIYTKENSQLVEQTDDLSKKNIALKQKNKALEQKLNDLKNIEKTMIERNIKTQ